MKETLFTRLASYSQNPAKQSLENFTTEVLVHLVKHNDKFREIFIRHIIRDGRIRRRFKCASAESQQRFGNGIVDIVLSATGSPVFVEVKIAAEENTTKIYDKGWVPQVQKYLDLELGHVAYLTTKSIGAPDLRPKTERFLGQFYFEDLYDHLIKAKSKLKDVGRLFLTFMEENEMISLEPFTKNELGNAKCAFDFAKKCENFLNEIRLKVEPVFQEMFQSQTQFTDGYFSHTCDSAYIRTKGKLSKYKQVKQVEICIWPENGKLLYGVNVNVVRTEIEKINRHLKWEKYLDYLLLSHQVKPGIKAEEYVKSILNDLKKLKWALDRVY